MTEGAERGTPRYTVVSDLPGYTVHDSKYGVDLFPTVSGNRNRYCKHVPCRTAERIADALNRDDALTEALKVAGEAQYFVQQLLADLPAKRDWLNPDIERALKDFTNSAALEQIRNNKH
jgi:hypothetical protein